MHDETIGAYLERLADRVPAPGGGAAAAVHVAQAAALIGMVARYSTGNEYSEHADRVNGIIATTDDLRDEALRLVEADAAAFTRVVDAYRLPRATPAERDARSSAISVALAGAVEPPADVVAAAASLVELAAALVHVGNRNVIADAAAAVEAARAGAATARINIEANLSGIPNPQLRSELFKLTERASATVSRADDVSAAIRTELVA